MDFDDLSLREIAARIASAFSDVGISAARVISINTDDAGLLSYTLKVTLHRSLHEADFEHGVDR